MMALSGACFPIEFVNNAADASWTKVEDVNSGCVSFHGRDKNDYLWVGPCAAAIPHGKGYTVKQGVLTTSAMNQGREYRNGFPAEAEDRDRYFPKAAYLGAYTTVIYARDAADRVVGPAESAVILSADRFLRDYSATATQDDLSTVTQIRARSQKALLDGGYAIAAIANSPSVIEDYLQKWGGQIPKERARELTQRKTALEQQMEANARARAKQEQLAAAQREQERARMRKTACSLFYPGYVGKYEGNGFLATADRFVVRYVNPSASTVTIEGMHSGNTLTYGQHVELSCFSLWEGLK
jgi:hypothetical protein